MPLSMKIDAPNARQDRPRIDALTGVRFFAAIAVVFYHYWTYFLPDVPTVKLFENGFSGVSFFYVLSGYILGFVYLSGRSSAIDKPRFWVARFARIYPAFALSILLLIPLNIPVIVHHTKPLLWAGVGLVSLVICLLLQQGWVHKSIWIWNSPSWSISVEAFFYLLFPVLAVWATRFSGLRRQLTLIALCCLVMLVAPALLLMAGMGFHEQPRPLAVSSVIFMPIFRIPEFMMGLFLSQLQIKVRSSYSTKALSKAAVYSLFAGIAGVLLAVEVSRSVPFVLRYNGIVDVAYVAIIFGLANAQTLVSRFLALPFLVLLGEASYSVYILQNPIQRWFVVCSEYLGFTPQPGHLYRNEMLFAIYCVALTGLSALSFVFIESPVRRRIVASFDRRRKAKQERELVLAGAGSHEPALASQATALVSDTSQS